MSDSPTRGILMFAHNNKEIDYLKLAMTNAYYIQHNLGFSKEQITIITDSHSLEFAREELMDSFIDNSAQIILKEKNIEFKYQNIRLYKDTVASLKQLPFYNYDRCDAYDLSPYDETILIDADYLILSDTLNRCWGHRNELMMSHQYHDILAGRNFDGLKYVGNIGITMYWATVVYFRKGTEANNFFNLVKHVRDHKDAFRVLYKIPGKLYRNDYSFSIAAHMMGGYKDAQLPQLPFKLYKTFDNDDVHSSPELNTIIFYLEKVRSPGDFMLTKWEDLDVHVMNKWAINRISTNMMLNLKYGKKNVQEEDTESKVVESQSTKRVLRKKQTRTSGAV